MVWLRDDARSRAEFLASGPAGTASLSPHVLHRRAPEFVGLGSTAGQVEGVVERQGSTGPIGDVEGTVPKDALQP
ncbi:MAG: hypothetical protein QOF20_1924 [Acidimicrobiaceae bacterium]|jgi:hypothetical protein|nr:hypothetical protein [Acidimicrobiaceae bacterium]